MLIFYAIMENLRLVLVIPYAKSKNLRKDIDVNFGLRGSLRNRVPDDLVGRF